MARQQIELDDLKRALVDSAGVEEGVDLDSDILDTEFEELGYDSLALMETAALISQEYQVDVDDDAVTTVRTPRDMLKLVNSG